MLVFEELSLRSIYLLHTQINPRNNHVGTVVKAEILYKMQLVHKVFKDKARDYRKEEKRSAEISQEDIVELLRNDLGLHAYRKAGELLMGQNMSCCYEIVEKFVGCISDHLEALCKERECPDECKEAVQSLIYAAARFADLPELRELRTLFSEKFGNSLQPYINKEFEESLRRNPPTKEMKIQLLHDIAQEFSLEFDSKSLEQTRINTLPSLHQESSEDETSSDTSSHDGLKNCSSSMDSGSSEDDLLDNNNRPVPYKLPTPPYFKSKGITNGGKRNLEKTTVFEEKQLPISERRRGALKASSGHQPELKSHKLPSHYGDLAARVAALSGREPKSNETQSIV